MVALDRMRAYAELTADLERFRHMPVSFDIDRAPDATSAIAALDLNQPAGKPRSGDPMTSASYEP
jgi:hypothetical protein